MEALELYLLGRARQSRRTAEDNLKSIEYFRRAVAADPQYVPALTGLAESLLNGLSLNRAPLEDVKAEVEPLINRAMQINPNLPEVLAVKGWLLTEEFRFDEALPLLQRATQLNPNDASSHRFLGNLYDRRAQPGEAMKHYSAAAGLDPMDFISHVFRCMELVDLGEFAEADAACARARELDPTNMWGPLTTAWICARAGQHRRSHRSGSTRRASCSRTTPTSPNRRSSCCSTQGKTAEARAVMRELPADDSFFGVARESADRLRGGRQRGDQGLAGRARTWPARPATGAELAELARLQLMAATQSAARATLAHAERILPLSTADMFDGSQIRFEYSAALMRAGIELKGGGDKAKATEDPDRVSTACSTRTKKTAASTSVCTRCAPNRSRCRARPREAQAALNTAWKKGWRATWRVRSDPSMAGLEIPK